MTNVKLINHSSVLVQEGDTFVLTDPWFEKPAFGSWLPVPPTSVHPAYLSALSKSQVTTTPENLNIRPAIRWLAMYGYVYQRDQNGW